MGKVILRHLAVAMVCMTTNGGSLTTDRGYNVICNKLQICTL